MSNTHDGRLTWILCSECESIQCQKAGVPQKPYFIEYTVPSLRITALRGPTGKGEKQYYH